MRIAEVKYNFSYVLTILCMVGILLSSCKRDVNSILDDEKVRPLSKEEQAIYQNEEALLDEQLYHGAPKIDKQLAEVKTETPKRVITSGSLFKATAQVYNLDSYESTPGFKYSISFASDEKGTQDLTVIHSPDLSSIKLTDGINQMVVEDNQLFLSSAGKLDTRASANDAMKWPYLFALPFVLNKKATSEQWQGPTTIEEEVYEKILVSYDHAPRKTLGSTYMVYVNPEGVIKGVSFEQSSGFYADDLLEPITVRFDQWKKVDGMLMATKWSIFKGLPTDNSWGVLEGTSLVSDIESMQEVELDFERPRNYITVLVGNK